jgi:acyl-CoA synthetase (AMP-forming)/AMP-acid ligase II
MFHAAVAPRALTTAWKVGEPCYIMRRFDVAAFAANVQRFGVTELYGVPPMFVALINHEPVRSGKVSLRSVKAGWVGAAPLTKETQARVVALLGDGARFTQVWGMTEANCLASRFEEGEGDETGSVGRLCPGMEGKIVDVETGEEIREFGRRGEACVRGESVIPGYYGGEGGGVNRKSWDEEGFYHSGDVIYVDEETKKLYIVDRVKELIKVRAFQVAPPEVEGVLLDMEGIVDAAVIGVKDKDGEGEVCRAYVVKRAGWQGKLSEQDVYNWVKGRLAKYKNLDGGVKFVEQIPKTASGKILKRLLREEYEREQKQAKL